MSAFTGPSELAAALKDVDLVVIPAGVPRKPGMTRDDLFNINAGIVRSLVEAVADNAPNVRLLLLYSSMVSRRLLNIFIAGFVLPEGSEVVL